MKKRNNPTIMAHCIVRNEERWIWYVINSVIEYVDKILVFDTGSTDNTVEIIKSINSPKIVFEEKGAVNKKEFTKLRQEMLDLTDTDWFLILDGDEIWPDAAIKELINELKKSSLEKEAVVVGEWVCIGDVFHYSKPLATMKLAQYPDLIGLRMVRAIKNSKGLHCVGLYGYESYEDKNNINISYWDMERLIFLKNKFFHMSFLPRSSSIRKDREVMMRSPKRFFYKGKPFHNNIRYPEVFYKQRPDIVPSPWKTLTIIDRLKGLYFRALNIKDRYSYSTIGLPVEKKDALKRKAVSGIVALSLRRVITQLIQTSAHVILARILFPNTFGEYAIIIFYLNIVSLVSDVGLQAALLQREKEPTKNEIKTIFTTLLVLGVFCGILMWLFSPIFLYLYNQQLNSSNLMYLQLISLAPLLYNLKLVSASLLERKINYIKLVSGEVLELFVLQALTVWFVLSGWGLASFVWGLILSRLFAVCIFFLLQPFPLGLRFNLNELKKFLPFGISYQLNTTVGALQGALAPVIVGGIAGATALGLVGWASGIGALPRALGEIVGRVIFPLGARVQADRKLLAKLIERSIKLTNIISFPVVAIIMALAQPITFIIFTDKWKDGIPSLYLFTLQSVPIILSTILINALLAIGRAKEVRNINFIWLVFQWILTYPMVKIVGFNGYAIAGLVTSSIFVLFIIELKKNMAIKFIRYTIPYIVYAGLSGICLYVVTLISPVSSLLQLFLYVFIGALFYLLVLVLFERHAIWREFLSFRQIIMKILRNNEG